MDNHAFLSSSLALPANAIAYAVSEELARLFPDRAILEGPLGYCDIEKYAAKGLCSLELKPAVHNQLSVHWDEQFGIGKTARNAWYAIVWKGHALDCLILTWTVGFQEQRHLWVIADQETTAEGFYGEVCAWNAELRDEVLVFDGGCWQKSDALFRAIRTATFENLVLAGTLKEEIREDLSRFFVTRETYEEHGVPWKRGVLFVGPAGQRQDSRSQGARERSGQALPVCQELPGRAHDRARLHSPGVQARRKTAPCILVLEDLDSLINANNRSFFLNELDGFAANTGVVALATTNHPERLDASILDRPSRFDRKYHFDIPGPAEASRMSSSGPLRCGRRSVLQNQAWRSWRGRQRVSPLPI